MSTPRNPTASAIVLGSINIDLSIRVPHLPAPGETVLQGEFAEALGGKGANQAVAVARLGQCHVHFAAAVGEDAPGERALRQLEKDGLDLSAAVHLPEAATGTALIMVDARGENLIAVASGANALLTPEHVQALPETWFGASQVLLACLEIPMETVAAGLQRAHEADLRTILNPAPARGELPQAIWDSTDILVPNETEASQLSGVEVHDEASAALAAKELAKRGPEWVVITRGAAGCLLWDGEAHHLPAYTVDPVDSTGAGDTFCGALAAAIASGQNITTSVDGAQRAAALATTRAGAIPSIPRREEVERFTARRAN